MKYLPVIILFLISCKKPEVKPEPSPAPPRDKLFNWFVEGYKGDKKIIYYTDKHGVTRIFYNVVFIDSSSIYVNSKLAYTYTYGYQRKFDPGDTVKFYFRGQKTSTDTTVRFGIWQDKNELPNISYFYPTIKKVRIGPNYMDSNSVSSPNNPIKAGKSQSDSVIVYRYDYIIEGKFIVN